MRGASVCLLVVVLLSGCAVSRTRGHSEVSTLVEQRSGFKTHWADGSPDDARVAELVNELLKRGLTRASAIEIALVNNRSLQATYEELGISQADMVQAGLLKNPSFTFSLGFPIGAGVTELAGTLVQDFLDLLMLPMRKKIARQRFEADILRVAHEALQVAADVTKQVVAAQASGRVVMYRETLLATAEVAADLADRQLDVGNISELSHATQRAGYEQAMVELEHARQEAQDARERLNRLLGLWGTQTGWAMAEAIPELPAEDPPLEHLEQLAIRQRLDVDFARKQEALMTRAVAMAKNFRLFGRVEVGGDGHQDPDGPRVFGPSLTLELPIFDQRQAQIAKLEAERRQSERRLQAVSVEARSEVRNALAQMLTARRIADRYAKKLMPLRAKIVEQTQLHYNGMLIGVGQLFVAKQEQVEAFRGNVEALREYWAARAELERAVGGRLKLPMNQSKSQAAKP